MVQIEYDVLGRKVLSRDPDLGEWRYSYDGFGNVIRQVDALGRVTTMVYDSLGRMTSKTDEDGTAEWVYDVGDGAGIGKLAAMVGAPQSALSAPCEVPKVTQTGGTGLANWWKWRSVRMVRPS
jgi:YD repeat-containing protein